MLPIESFREKILAAVAANPVTIIVAETGAGKSTQVPQFLLFEGHQIVVTQPRRLAARTVAARVAEEIGEQLGDTVGFRTAQDRNDSSATRLLFVTDGLALVRELMGAGRHSVLVLDEVHEWNLNLEVLVGWAKREIAAGASFKVVLMSATIEAERLAAFFDGAPVIEVPGRLFPVEDRRAGSSVTADVSALVKEGRNVLVFQPGKAEIQKVVDDLRSLDAEVIPLHGDLEPGEQARAFRRYVRPKVVVATNVAQTSITIDDIDAVVDGGTEKRTEVVDGVEGLYLRPISRADGKQRKGRAGRCKPGLYVDHCPAGDRPDFPTAEILRVRLDQTVLRLMMAGIDMEELELFHQPPREQIHAAKESLVALGCLTKEGKVTEVGRKVARLPLSANIGRMVVEAGKRGVVGDVINIAAILEVGGIVDRKSGDWKKLTGGERESDLLAQLAVFEAASSFRGEEFRANGIFAKAYFRTKEVAQNIRRNLDRSFETGSTGNRLDILKSVCAGMVDHLYCVYRYRLKNGGADRELAKESIVRLGYYDNWVVGVPFDLQIQTRRGSMTLRLVQMVTKVDPSWMLEVAPQLVSAETGLNPRYDGAKDLVVSTAKIRFNGNLVKEETVEDAEHSEAAAVFARWLAQRGDHTNPAAEALGSVLRSNAARQERARQLNVRTGEETFKVYTPDELFELYRSALGGARRIAEVQAPEALALPELDESKVAEVLREQPDAIELLGVSVGVEYRAPYYGTVRPPAVKVEADRWVDLPDSGVFLPNGRQVEVQVSFGGYSTISDTSISELKKKVSDHLNQKQWDSWTDRPEISLPDPEVEGSDVSIVTVVYGRCVVTGKELLAYGTAVPKSYRYNSTDQYFEGRWFRSRSEAAASAAVDKLEEIRAKLRREREIESVKAEAEAARRELQDLTNRTGWSEVPSELRSKVEQRRYSYLPSSLEDLRADEAETKAIIAEVEAELAERERKRVERSAAVAAGTALENFGGYFRRMGVSGNGDWWVVRSDGSLRDPEEVNYRKRYNSEGQKQWSFVGPDELALRWDCGTTRDVDGSSTFEVVKLPVGGCTAAQLHTVRSIEEEIGATPGVFGLVAKKPQAEAPGSDTSAEPGDVASGLTALLAKYGQKRRK